MSNEVFPFVTNNPQLGSFDGDLERYTLHGDRHDAQILRGAYLGRQYLRKLLETPSVEAVSRWRSAQEVFDRVIVSDVSHDVLLHVHGRSTIALYQRYTGEGYQTCLLAASANPPEHGRSDWWRRTLRPRLMDLIT